jgi:hypothetical protein
MACNPDKIGLPSACCMEMPWVFMAILVKFPMTPKKKSKREMLETVLAIDME